MAGSCMPVNPTPTAMVVQLKGGQHELSTGPSTSSVVKVLPVSSWGLLQPSGVWRKHFLAPSYITIEFK